MLHLLLEQVHHINEEMLVSCATNVHLGLSFQNNKTGMKLCSCFIPDKNVPLLGKKVCPFLTSAKNYPFKIVGCLENNTSTKLSEPFTIYHNSL